MHKGILLKGSVLVALFASIIPLTSFLIADPETRHDLLALSPGVAVGILCTLGLPVILLAWQSHKAHQAVFAHPLRKMALVLATLITALCTAGMYNVNFGASPFLFVFPIGLYGLFVYSGIGSARAAGYAFAIVPVIGWICYLGISLFIIISRNRQAARLLYLVLVALLIANIGGCCLQISTEIGNEMGW